MMDDRHFPLERPAFGADECKALLFEFPVHRGFRQSGDCDPSTYQVLDRVRSPQVHELTHFDTVLAEPFFDQGTGI